jgi:hypothetical protein
MIGMVNHEPVEPILTEDELVDKIMGMGKKHRNAACPCRSGKKYKDCCLLRYSDGKRLELMKKRLQSQKKERK